MRRLLKVLLASGLLVQASTITANPPRGHSPCPEETVITAPASKVVVEVPPPSISFQSQQHAVHQPHHYHHHGWLHRLLHHKHHHRAGPVYSMPIMTYAPYVQAPVMAAPVYSAPMTYAVPQPVQAPLYQIAPVQAPQYAPAAPQAPCNGDPLSAMKNAAAQYAAMQAYQQASTTMELNLLDSRRAALEQQQQQMKAMAQSPLFASPKNADTRKASAPISSNDELSNEIQKLQGQIGKILTILEGHKTAIDNHEQRLKKLESQVNAPNP